MWTNHRPSSQVIRPMGSVPFACGREILRWTSRIDGENIIGRSAVIKTELRIFSGDDKLSPNRHCLIFDPTLHRAPPHFRYEVKMYRTMPRRPYFNFVSREPCCSFFRPHFSVSERALKKEKVAEKRSVFTFDCRLGAADVFRTVLDQ